MNKLYKWSIRSTHVLGYTAPTMIIVTELYSEAMKIAKNSALGRFPNKWSFEVIDKEPFVYRKPKPQ